MTSITSINDTMTAINEACKAKGGVYSNYSCKTVSWDDVKRGNVGGNLSCWGANITDTYLTAKDGRRLFTVRSDNWNEKLGVISTGDIALVQGNQVTSSTTKKPVDSAGFLTNLFTKNQRDNNNNNSNNNGVPKAELKPITLKQFLKNAKQYGEYANLKTENLDNDILDQKCSIRFQTTFLPVKEDAKATLEFATEAYNYNTRSDADPRNLILLCTTQGIALQQDGKGKKRLYHHAVDSENKIHRYWLEAERSKHKVGGEQKETKEERDDAIARGKATSSVIGIKSMGTRFNVLMTIQIPLEQKKKPQFRSLGGGFGFGSGQPNIAFGLGSCVSAGGVSAFGGAKTGSGLFGSTYSSFGAPMMQQQQNVSFGSLSSQSMELCDSSAVFTSTKSKKPKGFSFGAKLSKKSSRKKRKATKQVKKGTANAARVSRGKEFDVWNGLSQTEPKRNESEHITVTIVSYFTIAGGVPSEADVVAAIDDMEKLYNSCTEKGNLADDTFDFMKDELTVKDVVDIQTKIKTQPAFVPSNVGVTNHDVFPE